MTTKPPSRVADYQARKESGRCVYPGCSHPAGEETVHCGKHAVKHRRRVAKSKAKRRETLGTGRCFVCGRRSATYRCTACSAREGRFPTGGGINGGINRGPIPQVWRVDPGTNWSRYRGKAKRGKPPTSLLDDQDLDFAVEEIQRAKAGLAHARSEAVQAMPKIQRDGVMAAALARLEVAERWIDEVRDRHKTRKA